MAACCPPSSFRPLPAAAWRKTEKSTPERRTWCGCPGDMNSVTTRFTTSAGGKKSTSTRGRMSQMSRASRGPERRTQSKRMETCRDDAEEFGSLIKLSN